MEEIMQNLDKIEIGGTAIFKIIGIVITALIALGFIDPSNKIVKIWDKIGDLQKLFNFKKK